MVKESNDPPRLIGIDCATTEERTGIAFGKIIGDKVSIENVVVGSDKIKSSAIISYWIRKENHPRVLLALDAPLGWPRSLSKSLQNHYAGMVIREERNSLFSRATDRFVHKALSNKKPLEVGANRIARTAHSALELLGEIRKNTDAEIPLAWSRNWHGIAAIEVYPAATLLAHNHQLKVNGYKNGTSHAAEDKAKPNRGELVKEMKIYLSFAPNSPKLENQMAENADKLDAAICCGGFCAGKRA